MGPRIGIGLAAFLAGLDKFFNILTNWGMYLKLIHPTFAARQRRHVHALRRRHRDDCRPRHPRALDPLGAYVARAWLLLIAINLVTAGFYDLAVRDVVMAIAAYVLAQLTEITQPEPSPNVRSCTLPSPKKGNRK